MHRDVRTSLIRKDDGSVLLWALGCFVISLMVIVTAVSVADVSQTQRELQNLTDAAALAAANQIATDAFLVSGDFNDLAIDASEARTRATRVLQLGKLDISLRSLAVSGMEVSITTSTKWSPSWSWFGIKRKTLTAEAKASVDQVAGG
jgi:uncharacterized membrane protein